MSTHPGFFYSDTEFNRLGITPGVQKIIDEMARNQGNYFLLLRILRGFAHCPRHYLETLHPDELALLFAGCPMTAYHHLHCLALMGWDHALPSPANCPTEQLWAMGEGYWESGDHTKIRINRPSTPVEDLIIIARKGQYAAFKERLDSYAGIKINWGILVCALVANQANSILVELLRAKIISPSTIYSLDKESIMNLDPLVPNALRHSLGSQRHIGLNSFNLVKLSLLYGNKPLLQTLNRYTGEIFASIKENKLDIITQMLFKQHVRMARYLLRNKMATFEQRPAGQSTALHAAMSCHFPHLQRDSIFFTALTKFAKKCVNHQDENGETALHLAVRMKDMAKIQWLLSLGANLNIRNTKGLIPLEVLFSIPERPLFLPNASIFEEILDVLDPQQKHYDRVLIACLDAIFSQHIQANKGRYLSLSVMMKLLGHLVEHLSKEACSRVLEETALIQLSESQVEGVDIEVLSEVMDVLQTKGVRLPREMSHLDLFELFGSTEQSDSEDTTCTKRVKVDEEETNQDNACARSNSW